MDLCCARRGIGRLTKPVGIGLEVHEDPYLRGGNDLIIKTGHTFSDEPGVYIEGKVSRLEGYKQSFHAHKTFRSAYALRTASTWTKRQGRVCCSPLVLGAKLPHHGHRSVST